MHILIKYALSKVHILIKYALSKVHLTNLSTALRRMIQRKRELEKRMQEEFVKARKEAINHALARMKTLSGKGGMPVPEDENDLNALIEAKYKL